MKRQSKAEEAIRQQVTLIQGCINECDTQISILHSRRDTLIELKNRFASDAEAMYNSRKVRSNG